MIEIFKYPYYKLTYVNYVKHFNAIFDFHNQIITKSHISKTWKFFLYIKKEFLNEIEFNEKRKLNNKKFNYIYSRCHTR